MRADLLWDNAGSNKYETAPTKRAYKGRLYTGILYFCNTVYRYKMFNIAQLSYLIESSSPVQRGRKMYTRPEQPVV